MKEHYIATLVGCGLGDTLGMAVEGWTKEQIKDHIGKITKPRAPVVVKDLHGNVLKKDRHGPLKGYTKNLKIGEYTDDTILTLAIAESIGENKSLELEDVAQRQAHAYEQSLQPDGKTKGAFGKTSMEGFKNILQGKSAQESGVIGGPGNAPPMKMSPIGLYMHATEQYENGLAFAVDTGKITHLDPRSVAGGAVQAHAIYYLLKGCNRDDFVDSLQTISHHYEQPLTMQNPLHEQGTLTERLRWITDNRNARVLDAHRELGSTSLIYESYPFALFMFQKHWDTPIEGLLETVNLGGDCDTTGAIYGALCGAKNGNVFPTEWRNVLQNKERLANIAESIYALNGRNPQ